MSVPTPDFSRPRVARRSVLEWLMTRVVVPPCGCWLWEGADSGDDAQTRGAGYAKVRFKGKTYYLHRLIYQLLVGKIPQGHQIDHKCKHWFHNGDPKLAIVYRRCCNPDHLEAVTQSDNLKRNNFVCQGEFDV